MSQLTESKLQKYMWEILQKIDAGGMWTEKDLKDFFVSDSEGACLLVGFLFGRRHSPDEINTLMPNPETLSGIIEGINFDENPETLDRPFDRVYHVTNDDKEETAVVMEVGGRFYPFGTISREGSVVEAKDLLSRGYTKESFSRFYVSWSKEELESYVGAVWEDITSEVFEGIS